MRCRTGCGNERDLSLAGSALDQLSTGDGFSLRRALGSAANGIVTGAVKGALIGSGAGIPVAFGADFAAGAAGSLLEQAISGERVNAGRGILGGLSNAVSGAIFGNVPFKNAGQAFGKGALAGAATSGLGYLSDLAGRQPKSGQMGHFPGGTVARTPYERLMDPRGICILQDVFGGGLGVRKAYGYRYEMRDPDQPVRDGFDLGDFLRSTLTGGLMGGLSGVAFYGMDKAVGALKGSLSGGSKGSSGFIGNKQADFYVMPNGDVVPATGYRYFARNISIIQNAKKGYIEARSDGMYFSFDKIDDSIIAQGKLQIPYRPEYRISFDTLNIIDDINIPKGKWGTASYFEPITKDFKNFGPGGATQMVTYARISSILELFKLR